MVRFGSLRRLAGLVALAATVLASPARAVSIEYTAQNLGGGQWSVHYALTGSFDAFAGVNILFPFADYQSLVLTSAPNPAQWSVLLTPPDAGLAADGLLTISPTFNATANALPIGLTFTYLPPGHPRSQPFELFDSGFSLTGSGQTAAALAVPEPDPATMLLVGGGVLLLWQRATRWATTAPPPAARRSRPT